MVDVDGDMPSGDIVVRAADTDILVILLHHLHRVASNIRMDVGILGRGNRRYVNVSAIASRIGPGCCSALAAFHVFTVFTPSEH